MARSSPWGLPGRAINDAGQIAGSEFIFAQNVYHAVLFSGGKMIDLGTLGGTSGSNATDINAQGQVVGDSLLPGNQTSHGYLNANGKMTNLGVLGDNASKSSQATAINKVGQVVGTSYAMGYPNLTPATLWDSGKIYDLNKLLTSPLTIALTYPTAITDNGLIVGTSYDDKANRQRSFLLTPVELGAATPPDFATAGPFPVPEPTTLLGFCLASLGYLGTRRPRVATRG